MEPITIKQKFLVVIAVLCFAQSAFSSEAPRKPVTVLYPDMDEPYRTVFVDIIRGIEGGLSNPLLKYIIKDDEQGELTAWLKKKNSSIVIALGKQGLNATASLVPGHEIIGGAVLAPPNDLNSKIRGITLSPSPNGLFKQLIQLSPQVKRVNLIYSEKYSKWLIPFAEKAAKENNLQLNALKAENLAEAATLYRDLITTDIGGQDAIWLPHDNLTVNNRTILPMILKEAWQKQFVVFSSNPAYVKRGVLFALFPDNVLMGGAIAALTEKIIINADSIDLGMQPLESLKVAVNIRTADHLDLSISSSDRRSFDLIFPAPR